MTTIFLTGFMGSGKSTMAQIIASEFNLRKFDIDELIIQTEGKDLQTIFNEKGEKYYFQKVIDLVKKIEPKDMVVALPSGIIKENKTVNYIKNLGKIFYLEEDCYTVLDRLSNDYKTKPNLEGHFNETDIDRMLKVKDPLYRNLCDATINVVNKSKDQVFMAMLPYLNVWCKTEVFLKIF